MSTPPSTPPPAQQPGKKPVNRALIVLAVLGGIFIISGVANANRQNTDSADAPAEESAAAEPGLPASESRFIRIINRYAHELDGVENDLKVDAVLEERDTELCSILDSHSTGLWEGTIEEVGADALKYQGYLTVRIDPKITIGTWNNALSDLGDDTLISYKTPLFKELKTFDVGQNVTFDAKLLKGPAGACVKGQNSGTSYGTDPDFLAKFNEVEAG